MIAKNCFSDSWIRDKCRELKAGDPGLLAKAVHALALLGHLSESGLEFVFKGGTSLLLHIPAIRRLSIDIDILCSAPSEELRRVLAGLATKPPFAGYEEDDRGARGLPHRRHFKFSYRVGGSIDHILLDVVEEERVPHDLISKPIAVPFLEIEREIHVKLPTVESLLADKLTAFAPKTIGIPLYPASGRSADTMQIVKQLFDIGELFALAEDLPAVQRVYQGIFALENEYRGGSFTLQDTLVDTVDAALRLSVHCLKGVADHPDALHLADGVKRIISHLVNHRFNLDDAKACAAKTALLSRLIISEEKERPLTDMKKMPDRESIRALAIEGEWEMLNRLKATLPEAFHYWYQASIIGRRA